MKSKKKGQRRQSCNRVRTVEQGMKFDAMSSFNAGDCMIKCLRVRPKPT